MESPNQVEDDSGIHPSSTLKLSPPVRRSLSPTSQFHAAVDDSPGARQSRVITAASDATLGHLQVGSSAQNDAHPIQQEVASGESDKATGPHQPHGLHAPYQPYRYVLEQDSDDTAQSPVSNFNTPSTGPHASSPHTSSINTPSPSLVSGSSTAPVSESSKKERARHTKVKEVVDPHICSVCFHQCVRKESIKKHMIDYHGFKREQLQGIPTRKELIKSGINVTRELGWKAPTKTAAEKRQIREMSTNAADNEEDQPNQDEESESGVPQTHNGTQKSPNGVPNQKENEDGFSPQQPSAHQIVTNSYQQVPLTAAPNLQHLLQQYHVNPTFRTDAQAVDACIHSIRTQGEPYSSLALVIIARAALMHLSTFDRARMLRECNERWNTPLLATEQILPRDLHHQDHVGMQNGVSKRTMTEQLDIDEREHKRLRLTMKNNAIGHQDHIN